MSENDENKLDHAQGMSDETRRETYGQNEFQPRAVPNIPRREPDSLPERPEKSRAASGSCLVMLLVLAAIVLLSAAILFQ